MGGGIEPDELVLGLVVVVFGRRWEVLVSVRRKWDKVVEASRRNLSGRAVGGMWMEFGGMLSCTDFRN
jgi:hypothetical protein